MDTRSQTLVAAQRAQLDDDGYVVVPGILSDRECDRWSQVVDDIWERQRDAPRTYTEEAGVRFVQNLLQYSSLFQRCATEPVVVEAVCCVLGTGPVLSALNGRRTDPGFGHQPLHDLNRRRGKPFRVCDAIWCLDEFTEQNGTRVLPGSHLSDEYATSRMTDPALPHPDERRVAASRGSVLVFNAHLIHAGGSNENDRPRHSVQSQFAVRSTKTHYDWTLLPKEILGRLTPQSRHLLGLADDDGELSESV